ncbi:hypothetical protein VTL71DRAFT_15377 [Oculimacula yallundae]|uniref:Uncharacterized protein n=1 Tax=Oculimacula yallundae TaxID=86028 RepID=A0ABR4CGE4_9HELO
MGNVRVKFRNTSNSEEDQLSTLPCPLWERMPRFICPGIEFPGRGQRSSHCCPPLLACSPTQPGPKPLFSPPRYPDLSTTSNPRSSPAPPRPPVQFLSGSCTIPKKSPLSLNCSSLPRSLNTHLSLLTNRSLRHFDSKTNRPDQTPQTSQTTIPFLLDI